MRHLRVLRPTGWLLIVAAVILFAGSVYLTLATDSTDGYFWSWLALVFVIVCFEVYRRR